MVGARVAVSAIPLPPRGATAARASRQQQAVGEGALATANTSAVACDLPCFLADPSPCRWDTPMCVAIAVQWLLALG